MSGESGKDMKEPDWKKVLLFGYASIAGQEGERSQMDVLMQLMEWDQDRAEAAVAEAERLGYITKRLDSVYHGRGLCQEMS